MPKAILSGQSLANAIYAITDKLEAEFAAEFIAQMRKLSRRKSLQELLDQIEGGYYSSVATIPASLMSLQIDTSKLNAIARKAMGSAARITDEKIGLNIGFNVRNPTIIEEARKISVDLSTNLSQTSQKILDKVIGDAMEGIVTRREAIKIIESRVGLLPAHSDAVDRYYDTLIQSGATKANAKKLADKYADRLLRYRANTIARTEIARATGIGQAEFWRQAVADGSLPPDAKRVWTTSYDERVCEICGPMNNVEVGIFEQWLTPNGFVDYPSAIHPNCRCSQGIAMSAAQKRLFIGKTDDEKFEQYVLSKFNPYHDELGRFTFASGGRRVSRMPKKEITNNINWDSLQGEYGNKDGLPNVLEELEDYLSPKEIESHQNWVYESKWPKSYLSAVNNPEDTSHYDVLQSRLVEAGVPEVVRIVRMGTQNTSSSKIGSGSANDGWTGGDKSGHHYGKDTKVFVSLVPRKNIIGIGQLEEGEFFFKTEGVVTTEIKDKVSKFNPYHDELGRFTFAPAGKRISAKPKMNRRALGLKGKVTSLIRFSSAERKAAVEKLAAEGSSKLLMPPDANGIAQVLPENEANKRYGKTVSQIEKSIKKLGVESITITPDFAKGKNAKRQMQATAQALEEAKAMGIPIDKLTIKFTTALRDADGEYGGDLDKRAGDMVIDYTDDRRAKLIADKVANDSGPRILNAPTVAQTNYTSDYPVVTSQEDLVAKYTYGVAVHEIGHHYTYVNANNPNAKRQFGLETPAKYGTSDVYEMLAEGFSAWWLLGRSRVKSTQTFYKRWLPFVKVVLNGNDTGFGIPTPEALLKAMVRKTKVLNLLTLSPAHPLMVYLTDGASIPDDIEKFNPNHDELGRFTFSSGVRRVSRMPKNEVKKPVMVFGDKYIDPSVVDVKTVESKKIQGMTVHIGMAGDKPKEAYAKYTSPKNGVTYDIISDNAGNTYAYVEGTGGKPHNRVAKLEIMVDANGEGKHEIYEVNTTNSHLRQGVASAMLEVSRMLLGGVFAPNSLTDQGSKWWEKVSKFNPYHDELGRFTFAPAGRRISAKPKGKTKRPKIKPKRKVIHQRDTDGAVTINSMGNVFGVSTMVKAGVLTKQDVEQIISEYNDEIGVDTDYPELDASDPRISAGQIKDKDFKNSSDARAVFYKLVANRLVEKALKTSLTPKQLVSVYQRLSTIKNIIPAFSNTPFDMKTIRNMASAGVLHADFSRRIIDSWAASSGSQLALMLSAIAQQNFNIDGTYRATEYEDSVKKLKLTLGGEKATEGSKNLLKALTVVVQSTYDNTQKVLKESGVTHLRLYRGFTNPDMEFFDVSGETVMPRNISVRPLSSWSDVFIVAEDFASSSNYTGYVASKLVRAKDVFCMATTGLGCVEESEFLIKGFYDEEGTATAPKNYDSSYAVRNKLNSLADKLNDEDEKLYGS